MKNIINVSIAGISFKLETEAYDKLSEYLDKIRQSYGDSADGKEILEDIEARIAEVILTKQDASTVVPAALIDEIIERLGVPEEISAETTQENAISGCHNPAAAKDKGKRIPHRLYRNSQGAKLGGVCSGLASYFNIDPVAVRLLFSAPLMLLVFFTIVLPFFVPVMAGLMTCAFMLYLLLWIVIPKAKTPLQKMEMKGERITKDKLEQTFREEFQSRSNDPRNIELRAKNEKNASVFSEIVSIIGKVILFFLKIGVAFIGIFFAMIILIVLWALFYIPVENSGIFIGETGMPEGMILLVIGLVIITPLLLAVYSLLRIVFGFKRNKPFTTTLVTIWVLTLVFGTVIFIKEFDNIRFGQEIQWNGRWQNKWRKNSQREIDQPARWIEQVKLDSLTTFTESRFTGKHRQNGLWHVLRLSSDTLFVAAPDSVRMPDDFVVKIRKGHPNFPKPTLVVFKSQQEKDWEKNKSYFESVTVEHSLQSDTLLLVPIVPQAENKSEFSLEAELFLPEETTVIVDRRINFNEYFTQ